MKAKFEENKEKIIELYEQNLSNRQIAQILNVHHNSIALWRKKLGLENKCSSYKIEMIDENTAKCSRCGNIKPIEEFQFGRKNAKYEYKFSYCNECRRGQIYLSLNTSIQKFLKDRYRRWKLKAEKDSIEFSLTFEDILELYEQQRGLCFYTEQIMSWGVGSGHNPNSISLDKIIPSKGYVKDNVVLCCNRMNTIKSNLSLDEMKIILPTFYHKIINYDSSLYRRSIETSSTASKD